MTRITGYFHSKQTLLKCCSNISRLDIGLKSGASIETLTTSVDCQNVNVHYNNGVAYIRHSLHFNNDSTTRRSHQ